MADVKRLVEKRHGAIDVLKTWVPRVALAVVFVAVGAPKFAADSVYVRIFDEIGLGEWFRYLTGVIEVGGGVLLLIPAAAPVGFILVGCTMAGAVAFWIVTHHAFGAIIPGALLIAVTGLGWAELTRFIGNIAARPGVQVAGPPPARREAMVYGAFSGCWGSTTTGTRPSHPIRRACGRRF